MPGVLNTRKTVVLLGAMAAAVTLAAVLLSTRGHATRQADAPRSALPATAEAPASEPPSIHPFSEDAPMQQAAYRLLEAGEFDTAKELTLAIIDAYGTDPAARRALRQLAVGWDQATNLPRHHSAGARQLSAEMGILLNQARIEIYRANPAIRGDDEGRLLANAVSAAGTAALEAGDDERAIEFYLIGIDEFRDNLLRDDLELFYRMSASAAKRAENSEAAEALYDRALADLPPDYATVDGAVRVVAAALVHGTGGNDRALHLLTEAVGDPVLRNNPVGWVYVAGHAASELASAGAYEAAANLRLDVAQTIAGMTADQRAEQLAAFPFYRGSTERQENMHAALYLTGITAANKARNAALAHTIAQQFAAAFEGHPEWGDRAAEALARAAAVIERPEIYQTDEYWQNYHR